MAVEVCKGLGVLLDRYQAHEDTQGCREARQQNAVAPVLQGQTSGGRELATNLHNEDLQAHGDDNHTHEDAVLVQVIEHPHLVANGPSIELVEHLQGATADATPAYARVTMVTRLTCGGLVREPTTPRRNINTNTPP